MKFELNEYRQNLSNEEILSDIMKTAEQLGQDYISLSYYKKHGKYSQTAIQNHFGSWKNALLQAGLRAKRNSSELKQISDEEYFKDLHRVAKIIKQNTVPYEAYRKYGKYSTGHIFHRFKKWNTVLELAGLNPTDFSKSKITQQQCFHEIERMWRLLGRQPTTTDIAKRGISRYSIDTYKRRFGGWRNALEAFIKYINDNDDENTDDYLTNNVVPNTPKDISTQANDISENLSQPIYVHRTPRDINIRLRFKVMKRDNFKCCACGASPAKDPSVELHIDHIIPWSKGGETEINNLQTLCSKCNLGKSNLT